MKLHLPVFLRKSVLASLAAVAGFTLFSGSVASADNFPLGSGDSLSIDYADESTISHLDNGTLCLGGGTLLSLSGTGLGDGSQYTLFTGVSALVDADGNVITLDDTNNAASLYFDTTQPGTGFWADATLQLTDDGSLRLVRHNKTVKKALVVTERQTSPDAYEYYSGVAFKNNISYFDSGGAIYANDSTITLIDNGSVSFSGNTAYSSGGAISGYNGCTITLSNNGSVSFSRNKSNDEGGAIYASNSTITLIDNGSVSFSGNTASYSGSAICGKGSTITLSDNGSLCFRGNKADGPGGAISGYNGSTITLSNNDSVEFHGNKADEPGGAIYGTTTIALSNNGCITFSGNTASAGGAISGGDITLSNNGSVTFSGNTASRVGAIYGNTIALSNNGSVSFSRNKSNDEGGAIFGWDITLSDNGGVTFSGNISSAAYRAYGGALYSSGNLSIRNNDSVLFKKNVENYGSTYRLRSIYAGGYGDIISLSAAEGKSIEFRDSVYIASGNTVNLNADYTDAAGVVHKQAGDIIFTGATTEADLLAMKGSAGTADEILNSRTSEVYAMTNLYGGRLRVEEGAIYKGYGITAMKGSAATVLVKDATLSHAGYELTFNDGTTLAAEGVSNISGNVVMLEGSNLALTVGAANSSAAVLTLGSAMDLQGVHLDLNVTEYLLAGTYQLIYDASYNTDEWSTDVLSISGCSADALAWENGVLTLKHTWNMVAEDGSAIGDSLGNLEVSGGAEVALHGTLSADADGPGKGHLLIAEGVAHLEQGANVEGDVVFIGTQEAERALVVNTQTAVERIVLDTEPGLSSSISVNADRELIVGTIEGDGVLVKDGAGTLAHTGASTCEHSSLEVKEGKLQNTGTLAFGQIELKGGHLVNQGTMSSVVMTGGTLSGCGVFDGLEMSGGRLIVGNSPGLQQYTDDLAAEGGELVFCVADLETAATMDVNGWRSEAYSQIDMGGNDLLLGENTTLTIALGGSLLEGYDGYFCMVLFTNVGNIGDFDSTAFTLLQNNTQFIITSEADGLLPGWEGGTNVDSWVSNMGYSTSGNNIVLSGNLKTASIPEPTTATLSLLALAALAARRRRK